jgi:hypothetical protein
VPDGWDFAKQILDPLPGATALVKAADEPLPKDVVVPTKAAEPKTMIAMLISLVTWLFTFGPLIQILKKLVATFLGQGTQAAKFLDAAGDGAGLVSKLGTLGLSAHHATGVVQMVLSFLKTKLGDETLDDLVDKIPGLAPLLASAHQKDD